MTRRTIALIVLVFFSAMLCNLLAWGTDRLVCLDDIYDSQTSYNNAWCVAATSGGDTIHAVWMDDRTNEEVYYSRSTDNGVNWLETPIHISYCLDGDHRYPAIAASGDYIYVVWVADSASSKRDILYRISTDRGTNWQTADTLSDNHTTAKYRPSVTATGSYVHVTWRQGRNIYFDRSANNGSSWYNDQQMTDVGGDDVTDCPSVNVSGSNVDLVWHHYITDGPVANNYEIKHMRNTNNGHPNNWSAEHNVTNDAFNNEIYPSVATIGSYIHVVWQENSRVWSARSNNGGSNWNERRIDTDNYSQRKPNVAVTGANVHVVWEGYDSSAGDNAYRIYYTSSCNNGFSWRDQTAITYNNSTNSYHPSITVITDKQDDDDRVLFVVWYEDFTEGDYDEVYFDFNQYTYGVCPEFGGEPDSYVGEGKTKFEESSIGYLTVSPNPMTEIGKIRYVVNRPITTTIKIYSTSGRLVRTLYRGEQIPGTYSLEWDGKDEKGEDLKPGVYFVKANRLGGTKVVKFK